MKLSRIALIAALTLSLVLAACGGDSDDSSGAASGGDDSSAQTDLTQIPDSGCGSATLEPVADPDGVMDSLPAGHQEQYAGYTGRVLESDWSDWEPAGSGPYTVGVQWSALNTDFQVEQTKALRQRLEESDRVGDVIFQSTKDSIDVPTQIQQFDALLRQEPDIAIIQPIAAEAFEAQIAKAKRMGIPVVVALQHIDSPAAVNVQVNAYQMAVRGASALVRMMDGEGNMLVLHAVPGSAAEVDGMAGLEAVLANCPDIEIAGDVTGNFVASIAKAETLKFLASNPGQLGGVFDINSMAAGAMAAIDQSGRPMPPVFIRSSLKAAIGYWDNHRDSFEGFATGISLRGFGTGVADVALKMLNGDGVKVNTIVHDVPVITEESLDEWVEEPGWDVNTPGTVQGPEIWMDEEYIDATFGAGSQS